MKCTCENLLGTPCHTIIVARNIPSLTQQARKYVVAIISPLAIAGFAARAWLTPDKTYRNDIYHFSIRIPKTYTTSETPTESGAYEIIDFPNSRYGGWIGRTTRHLA